MSKATGVIDSSELSSEFKANVATWHYKGNLWGGLHVARESSGAIHPTVADYVDPETTHSGGLYDSWAEAFAAIGAALDESAAQNRDRRFQVSVLDGDTGEPTKIIERGLTHERAMALLDKLKGEGPGRYGIQPDG